jgi:RNA polymerase sigma factor (sigma-70 family)
MLRRAKFPDAVFEAQDVLQEIYVAIWKKGINNASSLDALLMVMVRNKVVDRIRKRRFHDDLNEDIEDVRTDFATEFERKDLRERASSGMTPEKQQLLRDLSEGKSVKDIASSSDTGANTVRSRKSRMAQEFKLNLDKLKKENPQS